MKTVKYGSSGPDVELLQLGLIRSGYYRGKPDGKFGPETLNAVRRFQSNFGLKPDGIAGIKTFRALRPFLVGYFIIKIRPGDTYYKLAKRYNTTAAAIAAANPKLDANNLPIGGKLIIPYGFDVVPTNIRYTSELYDLITEGLLIRYPLMTAEIFGSSVLGKPLRAFRIGTGKNQIFINAAHHANEWITTPLVLKFLERYLLSYVSGSDIFGKNARRLYENTALYAVPLVNPDGMDLVNGALNESAEYYAGVKRIAAKYGKVPFPDGWKANIAGTDLNLNYPAGWEQAKLVKFAQGWNSPAPRDYVGTAALSAPEAKAVYDYTLAHDFRLILAYHTQGKVIYWKYRDIEPPKGYELGLALAKVSGYNLDEPIYESSNAGYKDWFILNYDRPGYTVEAGAGENPLPLSEFDSMYNANLGIMATALSETAEM